MSWFSALLIIVMCFGAIPKSNAQQANQEFDYDNFRDLFKPNVHKHNWSHHLKESKNELNFIFSLLFVAYKEVFSSQDIDACIFTPSCSVYAIETIKKNGAILGTFDAFDRISRCNPGRNKHRQIDEKTGKYFDPVKNINRKPE